MDRSVANPCNGILDLAAVFSEAMRAGVGQVKRLLCGGGPFAEFKFLDMNLAAGGERVPVGGGAHNDVCKKRQSGIWIKKSSVDRVEVLHRDLCVGGAGCHIGTIKRANVARY